jgi:HD-like signal output (HDOD) protein
MADTTGYSYLTESMEQKLKDIEALVSLPEIYLKFRQLMDDPESSHQELTELVSCDPNLTATVLKFVNSPLYGLSGEIDSISKAVHFLGINQLHEIVLAISVMSLDYPNTIVPLKIFWRSSLFSGVLARLLASQLRFTDSESMFVIGLLHQIGRLIIYSNYPDQGKKALGQAKANKQPVALVEQDILGFHYGHVGAKLMAQWRLPMQFQVIAYFQPTPLDAPICRAEAALMCVVHEYAERYGADQDLGLEQLDLPEAWHYLKLLPEQIVATLEQAKQVSAVIEKAIIK